MTSFLAKWEVELGRWYRSKERVSGTNPAAGFLTNKKWHLNEVKMVLTYQNSS